MIILFCSFITLVDDFENLRTCLDDNIDIGVPASASTEIQIIGLKQKLLNIFDNERKKRDNLIS